MLRVYAAAYGLNAPQHAVVEVSAEAILLRIDSRWLRFTRTTMQQGDGGEVVPFRLHPDGMVSLGATVQELDMAAEAAVRSLFVG